ncbi:hypothetical protein LX74_04080 [Elizabethkingia miricola]|uniref:Uncharacterized protein n=1 Tax=Elizabethkingia miricola TaxID=172045 RepID=A0ABY3NAA2_ELIMR|nr:hypothetical protein [Elizabethkingia miricola]TYO83102.1 hypothetical protein LX74_04080 [Elizabethkingia miricola]
MNKLELKDLAPYLPYGLSCHAMGESNEGKPILFTLMGLSDDLLNHKHAELWAGENENGTTEDIITMALDDTFPLLRPMSDLTEEITHGGDTFVPLHRILEAYCFDLSKMDGKEILSFRESLIEVDMSYKTVQMLCEWHIDFQGLIGRGVAINLQTIDNGK